MVHQDEEEQDEVSSKSAIEDAEKRKALMAKFQDAQEDDELDEKLKVRVVL